MGGGWRSLAKRGGGGTRLRKERMVPDGASTWVFLISIYIGFPDIKTVVYQKSCYRRNL